ncbi:MAG: alpha/beta hydrolase [Tepidisphaeraceae bacterium]
MCGRTASARPSTRATLFLTILLTLTTIARAQTTEPSPIPLYDGQPPNSIGDSPIDIPTITPYFPAPDKTTGAAIIIFPGGAYNHYGIHEGIPVAQWLNSLGITSFILKYRLGPKYHHPIEMQDAQRAIRLIRSQSETFKIDPTRLGVLGFSAGGHLASTVATHFDPGQPSPWDKVEEYSSRPDLVLLIYPVITMQDPYTHLISRQNLLGDNPDPALEQETSNELHVTPDTPPCFLVHTADDQTAPVQNSLMFADALQKAGVPFELHIFQHGKHGFALGGNDPVLSTWPTLAAHWLQHYQFVKNPN